jgi:NitT/TauT family transport system substrate-binding protein
MTTFTRRMFLTSSAMVSSCTKPRGSASKSVRLAVATPGAAYAIPLIVAEALGFFRRQGLAVEFEETVSGSRAMQALLGGSVDVTFSLFDQLIVIASERRNLLSFFVAERCPVQVLAVSPRLSNSVRTISDLRGGIIGVTSPGSSMHMQLNYLLHRHSLAPTDVSVVAVGTNAARVAALTTGKVTAAVLGDPGASILQNRFPNLVVLADTRTPQGTQAAFGTDVYPGGVLATSRAWLGQNAEAARAMTSALVKSMQWLKQASAADVMPRIPAQYRIEDAEIYEACVRRLLPALCEDGRMPAGAAESVKRVLVASDEKLRSANVDVSKTFTNDFITPM